MSDRETTTGNKPQELFLKLADEDLVAQADRYGPDDEDDWEDENEDEDWDDDDVLGEGYSSPGWVEITILKERENAYRKAIGFLSALLKKGFSVRCDFIFHSEGKKHTNSEVFWANCGSYPALHADIQKYIKLAAKKVNVLAGDEMEEDDSTFRRPDFYAVWALSMLDPTGKDFVDLTYRYMETIDMSYATGIYRLIDAYFKQYGITEQNADNILASEKSGTLYQLLENLLFRKKDNEAGLRLLVKRGKELGVNVAFIEDKLQRD